MHNPAWSCGQHRIPIFTSKGQGRVGHFSCLAASSASRKENQPIDGLSFCSQGRYSRKGMNPGKPYCELALKLHLWPLPGVEAGVRHKSPGKLSSSVYNGAAAQLDRAEHSPRISPAQNSISGKRTFFPLPKQSPQTPGQG